MINVIDNSYLLSDSINNKDETVELDGNKISLKELYEKQEQLKNSNIKIVEILPKKFKTLKRIYS